MGKEGGDFTSDGTVAAILSCPVIRFPDMLICHGCGLGFPFNGRVDGLKTLRSNWRVIVLCRECFEGVRSAQVCSYCFSWFAESERIVDCNLCFLRVHCTCVPFHHRKFSLSLLDAANFNCVDCRPIPTLLIGKFKKSGGSTSQTGLRFLMEDMGGGEMLMSEKKGTSKYKSAENTSKKTQVSNGYSELKRNALGDLHLVKKHPSIKNSIPDGNMTLGFHRTINESQRICRSSCPEGVSLFPIPSKEKWNNNFTVRVVESSSYSHHENNEVSTVNTFLSEDRGMSELKMNALSELQIMKEPSSIKIYIPDEKMNHGLYRTINEWQMFSRSSLPKNPRLFTISTKKQWNGCSTLMIAEPSSCFHHEKNKASIENTSILEDRGMTELVLANTLLINQENCNQMMEVKEYNTSFSTKLSLNNVMTFLEFTGFTGGGSNTGFATRLGLNTWTMPIKNGRFNGCYGESSSKLKRKSIDEICLNPYFKRYCRKSWGSGIFMQQISHPITELNMASHNKASCLKYRFGNCNGGGCSKLQRKSVDEVGSIMPLRKYYRKRLRFGRIMQGLSHELLPSQSSKTLQIISNPSTKYRFCDGIVERSHKLQRKNIDLLASKSLKMYIRKKCSSKGKLKEISETILSNSLFCKKGNGDLTRQIKEDSIGYARGCSFNDKVSCLSITDSPLLPGHSLKFVNFDEERPSKLQRKSIDAIFSGTVKKYYRKQSPSKRIMQGDAQSFMSCNSLSKCASELFPKEDFYKNLPDAIDNSNIGSALLQFRSLNTCLNSPIPQIEHNGGYGVGEGYHKYNRRDINEIHSDGSLKKYFRKKSCSRRIKEGNNP